VEGCVTYKQGYHQSEPKIRTAEQNWFYYLKENNCSCLHDYCQTGTHLGGLFGCQDRPLCTAGIQH